MKTAIHAEPKVLAMMRLKGQPSPRNTPSSSVQASPTKSNHIQPPRGDLSALPTHLVKSRIRLNPTVSDQIRVTFPISPAVPGAKAVKKNVKNPSKIATI